ncbi:MAG TPA: hypothetical protein VJQ54_10895, partial [Candidatus Sulfotelmatobacter sp.]|nr:hypothetical protein [Candidatus Sulfotelmatobacter sp.]
MKEFYGPRRSARPPFFPFIVHLSLTCVLVGSSGAFQVFAPTGGGAILVYAPLAVACWLLVIQILSPVPFPKGQWTVLVPLMILCSTPTLSFFWSGFKQKTMTESVTLLVFALLGITISKHLDFESRIRTAAYILGALVIFSVVVALFL